MTRLGSICSFLNGGTPSRRVTRYYEGNVPWVTGADISGPRVDSARSFITEEAIRESATNRVPVGTVLLVTRTSVGKVAVAAMELCFSQDITAITPDPHCLNTSYLVRFLRTKQPHLEHLARGATIKGVTREAVANLAIPLPPLREQRRIADILNRADALRVKRRSALAQLDVLTQSIFLDMFGDPATNRNGWPEVALGAHTSKIGSGATPLGGKASYKKDGISLIRSMNVRDGHFSQDGLAFIDDQQAARLDGVVVEPDDVLLNITGASVARVCLAPPHILPARVNQHVAIIRPTSGFDPRFLEQCLLFPSMKSRLLRIAGAGATREAITKDAIKRLTVIQPPYDEQDRFGDMLDARQGLEVAQGRHLTATDALFSSLQHRAFRGEI